MRLSNRDFQDIPTSPTAMVVKLVRRHSSGISLDAGGGRGAYYKGFNAPTTYLDISLESLGDARRNARYYHYVRGEISSLPFRSDAFNFLLCSDVLDVVEEERASRAISEFYRVTHGTIVVSIPQVNIIVELARRILYGENFWHHRCNRSSPLLHRTDWTVPKLGSFGFKVRGCLGVVTWVRFKRIPLLGLLFEALVSKVPLFAGTIIGVYQKERRFNSPSSEQQP